MIEVKNESKTLVSAIQRCVTCDLPTDRAWKTYIDKQYGQIWSSTGVCRHCWNAPAAKDLKNAESALAALDYRVGA